ncbi:MAG: App1 family protein [Bacteroidales bacterium]|nr:App1 family protein [Bacteroidales bacterium]
MPVVWQISAIHFNNKTLLKGVLLTVAPIGYSKQQGRLRNLLKVVNSYFIAVYGNKEIFIRVHGKTIAARTDKYGSFSVAVGFPIEEKPVIESGETGQALRILQDYPVIFKTTTGPFDVISDIDDTILVSYTAKFFKRIGTLSLTSPQKRKSIPFTLKLLNEFETRNCRVFYISKSESNLFGLLNSFIEHHALPKGILLLTPYLRLTQLVRPKKGRDFKLKHIRFILGQSENKLLVLIGDDSQRDMEIYTGVALEFPGRIANVFIRQTKPFRSMRQKKQWESLKKAMPSAVYFGDDDEVEKEIVHLEQLLRKTKVQ